MEHRRGFGTTPRVSQIYETTIADSESHLAAHFVTVPARSLGGSSYLFQGADWPLETLGLTPFADVPLGGVVRTLAACLVSEDVETFLRKFDEGFTEEIKQPSVQPPAHFAFAEYLTFARAIPFEEPALSTDSLGNILTAQGEGQAAYVYYEGTERGPMLGVAVRAGIVICGSAPEVISALEAGLRRRILEFVKSRPGEGR
jgi:hypothetical protein